MRRTRIMPADPKRSTEDTWSAVVALIASSLPAVPESDVRSELARIGTNAHYLIRGEHLIVTPLTLVAGALACDIFTVHGAAALTTEDPQPATGASGETQWVVYVPVPQGAPFTARDLEKTSSHIHGGVAPSSAGKRKSRAAAMDLAELIDPEALRRVTE